MSSRRSTIVLAMALAALVAVPPAAGAAVKRPKVSVLSQRADLVSGGNALVAIKSRGKPQVVLKKRARLAPRRLSTNRQSLLSVS